VENVFPSLEHSIGIPIRLMTWSSWMSTDVRIIRFWLALDSVEINWDRDYSGTNKVYKVVNGNLYKGAASTYPDDSHI
jgi:hypothetical protein